MKTYDAGLKRESLARELAQWKAAGFIDARRAARWHRGMRRLAKVTGTMVEAIAAELDADADVILFEDE